MTVVDGMIFYNNRVPEPCRERILKEIHVGHLRKVKRIEKARQVLWWPGLSEDIKQLIRSYGVC